MWRLLDVNEYHAFEAMRGCWIQNRLVPFVRVVMISVRLRFCAVSMITFTENSIRILSTFWLIKFCLALISILIYDLP